MLPDAPPTGTHRAAGSPLAASQGSSRLRSGSIEARNGSFQNRNESFQNRNGSFQNRNGSFQNRNGSFENRNESFQNRNGSFQNRNESFQNRNGSFQNRNGSFQNRNGSFQTRNGPFLAPQRGPVIAAGAAKMPMGRGKMGIHRRHGGLEEGRERGGGRPGSGTWPGGAVVAALEAFVFVKPTSSAPAGAGMDHRLPRVAAAFGGLHPWLHPGAPMGRRGGASVSLTAQR